MMDDVEEIAGGYWIPKNSLRIAEWQRQEQRLDHDRFLPAYCAQFIPQGGCAIDGGAFNGDHTLVYSNKAGPDGCIYAIEPGSLAFRCLAHNTVLFPNDNVSAHQVALGAKDGNVIHVTHSDGDLGMSFCLPSDQGQIPVVPIDSFNDRKIDFIKLDLEGYELEALRGANKVLREDRPVMVIEINTASLALNHANISQIISIISQFEYSHRQVDGQQKNPDLWDMVCWPSEMGDDPLKHP